ncbi:hypothetical protein J2X16_000587 [Pelomonas aquatica]|uniref:Ankyrin repeat domain-containing protein n=2 Tax=Pelomonas aquatica TaxID=431058 RepID=A0ABU1Z693_9BURK|nr:hypothetical protein [Pelomonas aquatica]
MTVLLAQLAAQAAHAEPPPTPRQLIDRLGVETRQLLEEPRNDRTPADAERAVAEQITAWARRSPGDEALIDGDDQGRTPLMLAASGAYPLVVKALLGDPIVKALVNTKDAAGQTAWMHASFAPGLTLVSCQPGTLTLDRYPLLRPYLLRMSALLKSKDSPLVGIARLLEDAGARPDPEGARRAWLARCPNTPAELRQALANGAMLKTLVDDAVSRQTAFSKTLREGIAGTPQTPPEGMKFITVRDGQAKKAARLSCVRKPAPPLRGALPWSGELTFKTLVATRAGIVEAVDFELVSPGTPDLHVVQYFRSAIVQALAAYQCEGDHVFEQVFHFKVD